jgi:hypothetical protein
VTEEGRQRRNSVPLLDELEASFCMLEQRRNNTKHKTKYKAK